MERKLNSVAAENVAANIAHVAVPTVKKSQSKKSVQKNRSKQQELVQAAGDEEEISKQIEREKLDEDKDLIIQKYPKPKGEEVP